MSKKIFIKSIIFNIYFFTTTFVICFFSWPFLFFLDEKNIFKITRFWSQTTLYGLKHICDINYIIKNPENMRLDQAVIYASKHQSAWETTAFFAIIGNCKYVLKQELLYIPLFGRFFTALNMVIIKRADGINAMKSMLRQVENIVNIKNSVVIFPEGTRTKFGEKTIYKTGIYGLYKLNVAPIVPIALNAGKCWPKRGFCKYPGTITVEFLPVVIPDLSKDQFMQTLESQIENACRQLELDKSF